MKQISFFILFLLSLLSIQSALSQSSCDKVLNPIQNSAGSSMAYHFNNQIYTPVPNGYKPFYISHFGRHGSRYHTSEDIYRKFYKIFSNAKENNVLTEIGEDVKRRIDIIYDASEGHQGELTEIGRQEQRDIATRMFENYRDVFVKSTKYKNIINSRSTSSNRVIESMQTFDNMIREFIPELEIVEAEGGSHNNYLNNYTKEYRDYYSNGEWRTILNEKREEWIAPDRLIMSLFKDSTYAYDNINNSHNFMTELFSVASILQGCPIEVSLYDIFTNSEIYSLWQLQNLNQYMRKGPSAIGGDLATAIAKPLLKNFIDCADKAIIEKDIVADLRFGHGEGLMPLAALMHIDIASKVEECPNKVQNIWRDFEITPMAGNIQWIFYRDEHNSILVKILLNEKEVTIPVKSKFAQYYDWDDIKLYYSGILQ